MILILRGHIRDSLEDDDLYLFINLFIKKEIQEDLHIYIHTWSKKSSKSTWRDSKKDDTPITESIIREYFRDISANIKHIMIDDDTQINLIGNLSGNICKTICSKRGWKNYIYGSFKIVDYIKSNVEISPTEQIINMRFDLFKIQFPLFDIKNDKQNDAFYTDKTDFIKFYINDDYDKSKICFLFKNKQIGMDNAYKGTITPMYNLLYILQFFLDELSLKYYSVENQEYLFYYVNEKMIELNYVFDITH